MEDCEADLGKASRSTSSVLNYLAAAYTSNPESEVSGLELQHELGLDRRTMIASLGELKRQGLIEWDPLLTNIWLRLTDKGIAQAVL